MSFSWFVVPCMLYQVWSRGGSFLKWGAHTPGRSSALQPVPYTLCKSMERSFCGVLVDGHTPSHTNKAKMCWCRWTRRPGMSVYQKTSNIGKAICVVEILNAQKSIVWANNKKALSNSLMRSQVIAFQIAYIWSPISITCLNQKKKKICVCQDAILMKLGNMQRIKLSIISLKRSREN